MKNIYVVRHCQALGQDADAPLSNKGMEQAYELGDFLLEYDINHIISSPYKRAIQSIMPFSNHLNIPIVEDIRLRERVLSSTNLTDWMNKLKNTFNDMNLSYEGGESSHCALKRIVDVVEEHRDFKNILLVTHGNIMSLLLHYYDSTYGFNEWKSLTNPDVYCISIGQKMSIKRLWVDE